MRIASTPQGGLTLHFRRSLAAGLGYYLESSANFEEWNPAVDLLSLKMTQDMGNGYEEVVYDISTTNRPALFLRLIPRYYENQ